MGFEITNEWDLIRARIAKLEVEVSKLREMFDYHTRQIPEPSKPPEDTL